MGTIHCNARTDHNKRKNEKEKGIRVIFIRKRQGGTEKKKIDGTIHTSREQVEDTRTRVDLDRCADGEGGENGVHAVAAVGSTHPRHVR